MRNRYHGLHPGPEREGGDCEGDPDLQVQGTPEPRAGGQEHQSVGKSRRGVGQCVRWAGCARACDAVRACTLLRGGIICQRSESIFSSLLGRPLGLPQTGAARRRVDFCAADPDQADRGAVLRPAAVQERVSLQGRKAGEAANYSNIGRRLPHQNLIQIYSRLFPRQTKALSFSRPDRHQLYGVRLCDYEYSEIPILLQCILQRFTKPGRAMSNILLFPLARCIFPLLLFARFRAPSGRDREGRKGARRASI